MRCSILGLVAAALCSIDSACADESAATAAPPLVEAYLVEGKLAEGEQALDRHLKDHPDDDQARFGLGVLQFVAAVEHLGQNLHRYGLGGSTRMLMRELPVLRLPVPENTNPETLTYEGSRQVLQTWLDDLAKAEATLAEVKDPAVKLPLQVGRIKFNWSKDPNHSKSLFEILTQLRMTTWPADRDELVIAFDRGDVCWLRGYCHLLSVVPEFLLAYDGKELFDATAHLFFAKVESPFPFLQEKDETLGATVIGNVGDWMDIVALFHLIRLPIKEPARMKSALAHLEQTIAHSREMWKFVIAETDDDHEWIPNAKQTSVLGLRISEEMIVGWHSFLDESEALLQGKKLIPFWRGEKPLGLNLRKVFTEPREFDLVLWIQGTAAAPYLEEGPLSTGRDWLRLTRAFGSGGGLLFFAAWVN